MHACTHVLQFLNSKSARGNSTHLCYFTVALLAIQVLCVIFRSCIFRSCVFQSGYLARHFQVRHLSEKLVRHFQVLYFATNFVRYFQALHFQALLYGPSFSRSCIFRPCNFRGLSFSGPAFSAPPQKQVRKVLWTRKGVRATVVTAELTSGHALASCYTAVACTPFWIYAN